MPRFPLLAPALAPLLLLAACGTAPPAPRTGAVAGGIAAEPQTPPYVRSGYEPFSRANAVAIAQREWRAFGSLVYDGPPDLPLAHDARPDQAPGLWQRVGDYWWGGQEYGAPEGAWNARYSPGGVRYTGDPPAWSAAFISYVMRRAGAGPSFRYSALHADYINAAARNEGGLRAERPETYAPRPGDLICMGRMRAREMRFDQLPAPRFFGHCDIVTEIAPGQITVIGGNVQGSVTMKHVPVTDQGMLAGPDGVVLDSRYPWFVVVRIPYDDTAPLSPGS